MQPKTTPATESAPTVAATRMRAVIAGTSYQQAHIDGLRQWQNDIEDAIDTSNREVAQWLRDAAEATSNERRFALLAEVADLNTDLRTLIAARTLCAQMLADADVNPIDPRPIPTATVAMNTSA